MTKRSSPLNSFLLTLGLGLAHLLTGAVQAEEAIKLGVAPTIAHPKEIASSAPISDEHSENQHALLLKQVAQWVSEQEGIRPDEVNFLPIDTRLD
jgi:hypothetical protein